MKYMIVLQQSLKKNFNDPVQDDKWRMCDCDRGYSKMYAAKYCFNM